MGLFRVEIGIHHTVPTIMMMHHLKCLFATTKMPSHTKELDDTCCDVLLPTSLCTIVTNHLHIEIET